MKKIFPFILLAFIFSACGKKQVVDLLVFNANIYTVDSSFSKAQAIAINDGKILAVGKTDSLLNLFDPKEKLDATGKFIFPGFIDAHCHFLEYGKALQECDLNGTNSWSDVLNRLKTFAVNHSNGWLIGRGWDQNHWANKNFPVNDSLEILFPGRPIILERVDGHAIIVSKAALNKAMVAPNQTIGGGEIITVNGKLTGVLIDNATKLITKNISQPTTDDVTKYLQDAEKNCFAIGLTSVQDCGLDAAVVELVKKLYIEKKLSMRMYIMLSDKKENYEYLFSKGKIETDNLMVNGFKLYADGALGSRGACLLQPYTDKPGHFGFLLSPQKHYDSILPIIFAHGFQACTHAIGDSANRFILKTYAKSLKGKNDRRWRIEHAQVINQQDFNLFGENNIIPSVQPTHATSDMYWAGERLGPDRIKSAYAYQQLLKQNGWIPLGTDFPVEDISPFKTFLAAVARQDSKGFPPNGFQMENMLDRKAAIRGMTIWAAKAAFEEGKKGSLEKGKLADFIMLDKDLLQITSAEILSTKVVGTWVGGKKVFGK